MLSIHKTQYGYEIRVKHVGKHGNHQIFLGCEEGYINVSATGNITPGQAEVLKQALDLAILLMTEQLEVD